MAENYALLLGGIVTPFIVWLVKLLFGGLEGNKAFIAAVVMAVIVTLVSLFTYGDLSKYLTADQVGLLKNIASVVAISQIVYRSIKNQIGI